MKKNPGRKERRKLAKAVHNNCFCKKYALKKDRWRRFHEAGFNHVVFMKHDNIEVGQVND